MTLAKKLNPKNLFKSKKNNVTRSETSSFNSSITTSSTSPEPSIHYLKEKTSGNATPTSVLPDATSGLLDAFCIIDTDKDGRITRSDLEAFLIRINGSGSEQEVKLMIDDIGIDPNDGNISLKEFNNVISSAFGLDESNDNNNEDIKGAFEFFDTDKDGMISADELFCVFKMLFGDFITTTLDDCKRMISSVDKKGDGFVCFEDFVFMMEQQQR
uniref:probable calcium-binding protein CML36 n=1 Tax=Erigeron canadensis TaxID=72917 RepID=UPI001CB8D020|nr:probable calcium-binding protein CML36 [Erigeron canadensis]